MSEPQGWRCSCASFVIPGEEHRCFYRDTVTALERIATALEKPVGDTERRLRALEEKLDLVKALERHGIPTEEIRKVCGWP